MQSRMRCGKEAATAVIDKEVIINQEEEQEEAAAAAAAAIKAEPAYEEREAAAEAEEEHCLHPLIWGDLPEHILERLFCHLSVPAIIRFRTLSRKWNAFLRAAPTNHHSSQDFSSSAPNNNATSLPWFLMFTSHDYQEAVTFDPSSDAWYRLPLPSFAADPSERHIPVASSGGLVCFSSSFDGHKDFIISNPLTRKWKKLPPMLNPPTFLETIGIALLHDDPSDPTTPSPNRAIATNPLSSSLTHNSNNSSLPPPCHYKVVVAGNHDIFIDNISTQVYDSRTNSWKKTSFMPRGSDPLLSTIFCNGFLYAWCCDPDGLIAYNLKEDSWSLVPTSIPQTLISNALIEWKGNLFMVAGLQDNETIRNISIWELVKIPKFEWVMIDTMPQTSLQEFLGGRTYFMSIGGKGFVLLYIGGCVHHMPMFLYDVSKKAWKKLPSISLPEEHIGDGLIDGISFEPNLFVSP